MAAITNRFGDWLHFGFAPVTDGSGNTVGRRLTNIVHATGHTLSFADGTGNNSGYWCVWDPVSPTTNDAPVLRYKFSTNGVAHTLLTEVHRLRERGSSTYDVTRYDYRVITNATVTNSLLSRVISPEGIILLENVYTPLLDLVWVNFCIGISAAHDVSAHA